MPLALLGLGFRPFYLGAAVLGALGVPLWVAVFSGWLRPVSHAPAVLWHAHEMAFGFAAAVIAGFLLTAVRNWTGLPTAAGTRLLILVVLWLSGRLAILAAPAAAVVDVLFLPALCVAVAAPIVRSRNHRNYKVVAIVAGLAGANALYHLANLGTLDPTWGRAAILAGVGLIMVLMALIGGRVIPAFTRNALPAARPRHNTAVEWVAFGTLLAAVGSDLLGVGLWWPLAVLAAAAHACRLWLWQPLTTRRLPLLWMMPMAYGWIPLALALRAASALGWVEPTAALHAFTVGGMASLMLAMMMRSSLGHTGRGLAASTTDIAAFLLLQAAAIVRVLVPLAAPGAGGPALWLSALLWSLAWLLFLVRYAPMLIRPRIDGQPG